MSSGKADQTTVLDTHEPIEWKVKARHDGLSSSLLDPQAVDAVALVKLGAHVLGEGGSVWIVLEVKGRSDQR